MEAHFFRHHYGKLVSILVCRCGPSYLEEVEDAVQTALLTAVETWQENPPENPSAWLYKVAFNSLMSVLRQHKNQQRILRQSLLKNQSQETVPDQQYLSGDCQDETLRMFFACCAPDIPHASRLAIALKIISGFSVEEIAQRLFTSPENIYKRIQRAKKVLKQDKNFLCLEDHPDFKARQDSVLQILYLMFTEGYLSVTAAHDIRVELCEEALFFANQLATHKFGQTPKVYALLALMHFHQARMTSRLNGDGQLILLENQQRNKWDRKKISQGMYWLEKSASGQSFSRYHGEAAIAAEHCLAKDYHTTRWDRIVEHYTLLNVKFPSGLYALNQAVALAECHGPETALAFLAQQSLPDWLKTTYLWDAVLADLNFRIANLKQAEEYKQQAINKAPTNAIKTLLKQRFIHS